MKELLWTNIKVNLRYFQRNRWLHVLSILILAVMGLFFLFIYAFLPSANRGFSVLTSTFYQLTSFVYLWTILTGLMYMVSHMTNRSLKLVLTKPYQPSVWLSSSFLAPIFIAAILFLVILAGCLLAAYVWDIPFQWGFAYVTIYQFLITMNALAFIILLTVFFHPVVAIGFFIVIREGLILSLLYWLDVLKDKTTDGYFLNLLIGLAYGIYEILPANKPFAKEITAISATMRVSVGDWMNLVMVLGYSAAMLGLCYMLSVFLLRRKQLN